MSNYEFLTVQYVSDLVKFEPVNIGIILVDRKNKTLYRKYITNFDELFRRIGVKTINGLEQSFYKYVRVEDVTDENILYTMYESPQGSIRYSKPVPIKSDDDVCTIIHRVFGKMISIMDGPKTTRKVVVNVGNGHAPFHISKVGRDFLRARLGDKRPNMGEYAEMREFADQTDGRPRHDQVLVDMVETLGKKSYDDEENVKCKLEIREIHVDEEYVIIKNGSDSDREYVEIHKRRDVNDR